MEIIMVGRVLQRGVLLVVLQLIILVFCGSDLKPLLLCPQAIQQMMLDACKW
jgi:hypothetical protein